MEMKKPRAMQPGQTVGLVAPAFALESTEKLWDAVVQLERAGYRVKVAPGCIARHGAFAGPDDMRATDINAMFADDTVDAILCVRGGYGAMRLLDMLRYDVMRANPKVFSGYSDITALHAAMHRHAGIVTFHGLMAVSDLAAMDWADPFSWDAFVRVVGNPDHPAALENPPGYALHTIAPGYAEGPLVGGNLMLVAATLGTPYAELLDGAILFLEEVDEHTYCVDRMLMQLSLAGVFERDAGVLLGAFEHCTPRRPHHAADADRVIRDVLGGLPIPVLSGLRCGHVTPKLTLPLGVRCALDASNGTVRMLEPAVR